MKNISIYITVIALIFSWCKSPGKINNIKTNEHAVMADNLSLLLETGSPRIWTTLSDKSGTSVYMIVYICESDECVKSGSYKLLGAVLPENSSTRVIGEIFSYNLARILGVEDIYGPGAHITLRGEGLKNFRDMILKARYGGLKEANRRNLIKMTDSADKLYCAYKKWQYRPCDLDRLENENQINTENILARYIMADEDKPGPETVTLSELSSADKQGQGKAVDLARQLSAIMIIDMLTAQWDRWSGGNIQAIVVNGNMKIVAFDNGGTFKYSSALLDNYLAIVTRFDKKTADILRKMDRFLNKKTEKLFLNYTSEDELRNFLGVISGPDNLSNADWIWRRFKRNLAIIIAHIEKSEQIYGPDRCYF